MSRAAAAEAEEGSSVRVRAEGLKADRLADSLRGHQKVERSRERRIEGEGG